MDSFICEQQHFVLDSLLKGSRCRYFRTEVIKFVAQGQYPSCITLAEL